MTNIFGQKLDPNGYAPSIVQPFACSCFLCGNSRGKLDRHEAFGGARRQKSKAMGLWVLLCHDSCHENGKNSVQKNAAVALQVQQAAQAAAMDAYNWSTEDFRTHFYKNYL